MAQVRSPLEALFGLTVAVFMLLVLFAGPPWAFSSDTTPFDGRRIETLFAFFFVPLWASLIAALAAFAIIAMVSATRGKGLSQFFAGRSTPGPETEVRSRCAREESNRDEYLRVLEALSSRKRPGQVEAGPPFFLSQGSQFLRNRRKGQDRPPKVGAFMGPYYVQPLPPLPPLRPAPRDCPALARKRLYLSMAFFFIGLTVGVTWDRIWHGTHPFETFYSPPHLFIYGMAALSIATAVSIGISPHLRPLFGPGMRIPVFPHEIPYPLLILGGGMACVALAGGLDDGWHSTFGLDETSWSTPHAMLGWGLFLTSLGFLSCRLALRPFRPMSNLSMVMFGYLLLASALNIIMGPLGHNNTPQTVEAIAAIPILAAQPPAQHAFAIYLAWNLDRTNPLFPLIGALASGVGLSLMAGLERRQDFFLVVVFLVSLFSMSGDRTTANFLALGSNPAAWLPLPVLPAALVLVFLQRLGRPDKHAYAAAGLTFGILTVLIWGTGVVALVAALLAGPAMVVGAFAGRWIWSVVEAPTRQGIYHLVPVFGLVMPLLLGIVDLYLRTHTA